MVGIHFFENFVGQVTSVPPAAEPVGLAVRAAVVLGVVAAFGAGTLRRDGPVPSPPPTVAARDPGRPGRSDGSEPPQGGE